MRSGIAVTALLAACASCPCTAAHAPPNVAITNTAVVVSAGAQKLTVSLEDAVLELATPYRDYRFTIQIDRGSGWTLPLPAKAMPRITRSRSGVRAAVTYPVPDERELDLTIEAYEGIEAVFVTSRLRVCGEGRSEYYFWCWNSSFDHYFVPSEGGIERRTVDTKAWSRLGYHNWVFLPGDKGGLAVLTTGSIGRAPGESGEPFLNALPRSGYVGTGRSLDVTFGIAAVKDAEAAAGLWAAVRRQGIAALRRPPLRTAMPKPDYGMPAPKWLRDAELYSGFYRPAADWNRTNIRDRLSHFPLIVGVPHSRAVIDRCHRAGIRVIPYVNYMELLNTEIEKKARGVIYYEWLQSVCHETLDLVNHPNWVCVDENGKDVPSIWGSANGHPGLFYTCFHQMDLHEAALEQVRKLMEMGADGVFIDNGGPVTECLGAKLGKHQHAEGATNTRMYQRLEQEIYRLVKSFGNDRIVMINSGIIPEYWAWCDAQMWESCYCGAGTAERMHEWAELQYAGELHADAVRRGKVPVILSYLDSQPAERRHDSALFTYACARLYGFLWADWFTLDGDQQDRALANAIYRARLGRPAGSVNESGEILYREFENGIVVLNPKRSKVTATVSTKLSSELIDIASGDTIAQPKGRLRLDIPAESARVLVVR